MTRIRDFKETFLTRIEHDLGFREPLIKRRGSVAASGDAETGKSVLRDYINATVDSKNLEG